MNTAQFASARGTLRRSRIFLIVAAAAALAGMAGCNSGSNSGNNGNPELVDLTVRLFDVNNSPIAGASVSVSDGNAQQQATSDSNGQASFQKLRIGEVTITAVAAEFETVTESRTIFGSAPRIDLLMNATRAWAAGSPFVLGTRALEVADDGSRLVFSVDVAVIDEDSQALETLTADDFHLMTFECGWGGPRDCASNADGGATGNGGFFSIESGAEAFTYRPGGSHQPWLTAALLELSPGMYYWDQQKPALKSFFQALGGNDQASLLTLQLEDAGPTLTQHGPFTSDGSRYLAVIDELAMPAGEQPAILDGLLETIRRAAEAANAAVPGTAATVLVLARQDVSPADIRRAAKLANELGVHISMVAPYSYGVPEMAVATGGFVAGFGDTRALGMIFGALENALGGSLPSYRMQFRLAGVPGTFVSGGNAKVSMRIRLPSDIPNSGAYLTFDVAIP